jgi:hypothetical protein
MPDQETSPAVNGTFEYGGYHFTPYRQFGKREVDKHLDGDSRPWKNDEQYAMRNMSSDSLGITAKSGYSHGDFYAASGGSKCDIFRCEENGRLYVPGANELFRYTEPKQRARKQSLLGALDGAKQEVAKAAAVVKPTAHKKAEIE